MPRPDGVTHVAVRGWELTPGTKSMPTTKVLPPEWQTELWPRDWYADRWNIDLVSLFETIPPPSRHRPLAEEGIGVFQRTVAELRIHFAHVNGSGTASVRVRSREALIEQLTALDLIGGIMPSGTQTHIDMGEREKDQTIYGGPVMTPKGLLDRLVINPDGKATVTLSWDED